jgi:hypothetical protein
MTASRTGRPLSAAQLQHNRNIASLGGKASTAKYGGYHFAHISRTKRRAGQPLLTQPKGRQIKNPLIPKGLALTPKTSSLAPLATTKKARTLAASRAKTTSLPSSLFTTRKTTTRRRPATAGRR